MPNRARADLVRRGLRARIEESAAGIVPQAQRACRGAEAVIGEDPVGARGLAAANLRHGVRARRVCADLVETELQPGAGGVEDLLFGLLLRVGADHVFSGRPVAHQIIARHRPAHRIGANLKQQGKQQ